MHQKPLAVSQAGMHSSSLKLEEAGDQIEHLQNPTFNTSPLPPLALGAIGEPARLRYNIAYESFQKKLREGAQSADRMSQNVTVSGDGYVQADDANVQRLINVEHGRGGDVYWSTHPVGDQGAGKGGQGVALAAGAVGAGATARYLDSRVRSYKLWTEADAAQKARFARTSQRTATLLKFASGLSVAAAVGAVLWSTAVSTDDEALNDAVLYWDEESEGLADVFGFRSEETIEALQAAWAGDAMEAADKKIRDFVTAGRQLADRAASHSSHVTQVVNHLNTLHDMAFAATVAEIAILVAMRAINAMIPTSLAITELVGRRLALTVISIHGLIAAAMGAVIFAEMDDEIPTSKGVPETGFPKFAEV
ncbi:hypothetical protein AB0M44_12135 [Streptosporangium subroseum]|uniref:hypothetical protein n=1 Tax=Streptosporangium subroseum TaxID=106412 RepID=UPI0034271BCE